MLITPKTQNILYKTASLFTLATAVISIALLVLKLTKGQWVETFLTKKLNTLSYWQILCGISAITLILDISAGIILYKQKRLKTDELEHVRVDNPTSSTVILDDKADQIESSANQLPKESNPSLSPSNGNDVVDSNKTSNSMLGNSVDQIKGVVKPSAIAKSVKQRTTVIIDIDNDKLQEIFGYLPTVNVVHAIQNMDFTTEGMVISTGLSYNIIGNKHTYTIWPSGFSKTIASKEITGDGIFDGLWDDVGQKLAALFFADQENGAVIYFNGERRYLQKKPNGEVAFTIVDELNQ